MKGFSVLLALQALAGLMLCLALLAPAAGQTQAGAATPWSSLSPARRAALAPLQQDWGRLDATRQQKWLEIADRLPGMPSDERERMQQRMSTWAQRTPEQRGQARANFQEARQLPPQEREARWQAYQALEPEQKKRLAERADLPKPKAGSRRSEPAVDSSGAKSNLVRAQGAPQTGKPVAPTVVQAAPGATTTLVTRPPRPPAHQQAGMPKITATPGFVDSATLLPQRGAQGAATRAAPSASPPAKKK